MHAGTSRKQRGASVIEFAFVAFILFLIMWGIFEFGHAFYVRNSTQHLTRCIAREAVVRTVPVRCGQGQLPDADGRQRG